MTLDEIRKRLEHSNLKAVAKESGVSYNAVYRFVRGNSSPYYETVQRLTAYLENRDG